MQSLHAADKLDKNDFCHSTYAMKMKQTVEHPTVLQSCHIADATFEFDDDKEIQEEQDDARYRKYRPKLDIEMMQFSGLEIELRIVDMNSQIPMFIKCTQGEQMPFKLQASGSIFGGAEQNLQGLKVFDFKINMKPLVINS